MEFSEGSIQKKLSKFLSAPLYDVDNLYVFSWESDKLLKTRAGYFYEFEIKISRADFKNDFKNKQDKHAILGSCLTGEMRLPKLYEYYERNKRNYVSFEACELYCRHHYPYCFADHYKKPNYFYYAVPEGLIDVNDVPDYAGLVYILDDKVLSFDNSRVIKKAPLLHKEKYTDEQLGLGEKFYYNMVTWRNRAHEWEYQYHQKLTDLKTEIANKGQEMTYKEMQMKLDELKESEGRFKKLYFTMVEGADYNSIERRLLMNKIKEFDPNFDFKSIMEETDRKFDERKNRL